MDFNDSIKFPKCVTDPMERAIAILERIAVALETLASAPKTETDYGSSWE